MYVATDEPALYAFSLSTGQKLWDWPLAHATANQVRQSPSRHHLRVRP
jgi:outer membrane protein assembly factor BamB